MPEDNAAINVGDFSSFIQKRHEEFLKIDNSGYGLTWLAQIFYRYWSRQNRDRSLELWGNMGRHYTSQIVWQFSEVTVSPIGPTEISSEYKSDIYILALVGKERRIKQELLGIQKSIRGSKQQLPLSLILIRFENLEPARADPLEVNPEILFPEVRWSPSFEAILFSKRRKLSIGQYTGTIASLSNPIST
ncbi:hypothetical protein ACFL00_04535 [Pseudomonadota bacterium]